MLPRPTSVTRVRTDQPDMPDHAPQSLPDRAGLQDVSVLVSASAEAVSLAALVMRGATRVSEALERVAAHLGAEPRVDSVVAALTTFAPDDTQGWVHLGERAWLKEWLRPGSPCRIVPEGDAGPEAALTMPWLSQALRHDVAAIPDSEQLPTEAEQDRRELVSCGARAVLVSAQNADGTMYGSLSAVSAQPGPWTETQVADLRLLSAALTSRMAAEQAKRSLADAIALGDQARASQQQFFAAIGHELRTPISAIVGFAEVLADEASDLDLDEPAGAHDPRLAQFSKTVAQDAGIILRAGEQLLDIVEDLLSTGRVLGAAEAREQVAVVSAVDDIIHWHRTPARAGGVTVTSTVGPDARVHVRPSGLRQVLANLVGNAIVHNRPGGSVEISATGSVGEGGEPRLRIMVRDTGPGLEPDQLSRVFDSFVRFADAEVKGTGLGLPLARAVAERDGGVVGAESVAGEGSVFWVDLPAT